MDTTHAPTAVVTLVAVEVPDTLVKETTRVELSAHMPARVTPRGNEGAKANRLRTAASVPTATRVTFWSNTCRTKNHKRTLGEQSMFVGACLRLCVAPITYQCQGVSRVEPSATPAVRGGCRHQRWRRRDTPCPTHQHRLVSRNGIGGNAGCTDAYKAHSDAANIDSDRVHRHTRRQHPVDHADDLRARSKTWAKGSCTHSCSAHRKTGARAAEWHTVVCTLSHQG